MALLSDCTHRFSRGNCYTSSENEEFWAQGLGGTARLDTNGDDGLGISARGMDIDTSSMSFSHGNLCINSEGEYCSVLQGAAANDPRHSARWKSLEDSDSEAEMGGNSSLEESSQLHGIDDKSLLQAVVFIEDAYKYRSIDHKVDRFSLRLYRHYHSTTVYVVRWTVIIVLHILAFFEFPSSLTRTSDMRYRGERPESPCWLMMSIELLCLLVLLADNVIKGCLLGRHYFLRHKWNVAATVVLVVSFVDWTISASFGCTEVVRFRRILRPFFILQNSSLMKKIVNCLRMTMPEIFSVLIMLGLHLYIFTLFAMLLFPVEQMENLQKNSNFTENVFINTTTTVVPDFDDEGHQHFTSLLDSFMSLLVLLTTANNPDVTMAAYSSNRLYSIFFIIFLIIGLYCFWNMLTAVIYNQFRGYFLYSMQSSLSRRRLGVRAAFEVLRRRKRVFTYGSTLSSVSNGVGGYVIMTVLDKVKMAESMKNSLMEVIQKHPAKVYSSKEFQKAFLKMDMHIKPARASEVRWVEHRLLKHIQAMVVHRYFSYFGILVAFCNVVVISAELPVEYKDSFDDRGSDMRIVNFAFAIYYVLEQLIKVWANGIRRYIHSKSNVFDAFITLALAVGETYSAIKLGVPFTSTVGDTASTATLWNALRIINILIMVRLLKIVSHIESMRVISSVLLDLVKNMKAFAGVLIVVYYSFAILGMELFQDAIQYNNVTESNQTYECGTYQQLQYWSNNFDDFAASIVVLWDVMVVNNWMVFLHAYREATSPWSYMYFVAWWLISVAIVLNLFTALIMENFILKWDRSQMLQHTQDDLSSRPIEFTSVHDMFRGTLREPADNELLLQVCLHRHLSLDH